MYDMFRRHGTQRPSVIRPGYVETTLEMASTKCSEDTAHKDLRSPKIRRGEKDLQTLTIAFHNFIYPFEVEVKEDLFSISSGARTHAEVANDILNVETVGIQNLYTEEVCCQNCQLPCISSNAVLDIS